MNRRSNPRTSLLTALALGALVLCFPASARSQRLRGELRIELRDNQGAAVESDVSLVSEANQVRREFRTNANGEYTAQELPFGVYRLSVTAAGFAPWSKILEVRSEVPQRVQVTLGLAAVATQIQVSDSATMLDPGDTGAVYALGRRSIQEQLSAQPARDVSDLANDQPGWLYEANGVLHPRGAEYAVQYIFDGLPLTQNRSPAFAPAIDTDNVESMRVLTAGYPAEYGRKMGGIVEVTTGKNMPDGFHGQLEAEGGSFSTASGSASGSYAAGNSRFSASGSGFHTNRYLDPPVLENFTNGANAGGISASYERDLSEADRIRLTVRHSFVRFQVPNELVQQEAGQRQDAENAETAGEASYQHVFSPALLLSLAGSVRDSWATLRSNDLATPVIVDQNRGYREGYARGDLAGHRGHHDWKAGADSFFTPVRETLGYFITDPSQFDEDTEREFQFSERRWDIEPSFYVQDQMHYGNWNISAGLRFDHYGFVVHENAWSPRLGVSRYFSAASLLIHASYDRVFQTPAIENLLLASSPEVDSLSDEVLRLPVRPGRGNYYEVGATKTFFGTARVDVNVFRRDFRNYSDDDVLLDTGVSFPIAFASARIVGEEVRVAAPNWRNFSGYLSFANQSGYGRGPITGGLFLGEEAGDVLTNTGKFAVSQDQRNTLRARVRYQAPRNAWLAFGAQYGSGLPVEAEDGPLDYNFLLSQYGPAIVNEVNFDKGRVRPSFSFDAAAGFELYRKEATSATLQIQADNLMDRVNVTNFASLFSGTAVAAPRSVSARLRITF